jgi:Fe-S-cluster containining protein
MSASGNGKPRREDLKPDENLCDHCTAKCCQYFALPMDEPTTPQDFDFLRWFLLHDRASVFTEDETWYLLVHTPCKHLLPDNRCGIYDRRPQVCRDYTTAKCEYHDDWTYERYFETPEQVEEYAEAIFLKCDVQSIRSPKPPLLPVLRH